MNFNLWQHYSNKKFYVITNNNVMLQVEGVWYHAYEYICLNDETFTKYVRTQEEFKDKFHNTVLEVDGE